jgi:hypothetical protein
MQPIVNEARHEKTGNIHAAYELIKLPYANDGRWVCVDEECAIEMIPVACRERKEPFKVSPHFRQKEDHKSCCSVTALAELAIVSRKKRVQTVSGFPVAYPSKVVFEEERQVVTDEPGFADTSKTQYVKHTKKGDGAVQGRPNHHRTVRTIRPVCQLYANIPHDLDLFLEVPECFGATYGSIFHRIGSDIPPDQDKGYIFYDQIRFTEKPVEENGFLKIKMLSTVRVTDNTEKPRWFKVDMRNWNKYQRRYLLEQIEEAQDTAKSKYKGTTKKNPKAENWVRAWIFFVSHGVTSDTTEFRGTTYASITVLACEMPYELDAGLRKSRHRATKENGTTTTSTAAQPAPTTRRPQDTRSQPSPTRTSSPEISESPAQISTMNRPSSAHVSAASSDMSKEKSRDVLRGASVNAGCDSGEGNEIHKQSVQPNKANFVLRFLNACGKFIRKD